MALSETEKQVFGNQGFLIFPGLLSSETIAEYTSIFQELVEHARTMERPSEHFSLAPDGEGKPIPGLLHKVQGVCVVDERVLGLARNPEIIARIESLIGPNVDMFGTKFFPMNIAGATSTGWHQDNHYFGTNSGRVVSCAIYLDATDTDNGCLMVLPGSHKSGELTAHDSGSGVYAHGQWASVDESMAVDVVCPAGTVVLFSANLLHGARPNLSGRRSFRTAWHYIPADLPLEHFPRGVYKDRHIVLGS